MTPITPVSQRKGATMRNWRFATAMILTVAAVPSLYAQGRVGPQSVAPIAEKLIDAVVNISTSQTMKGSQGVPLPNVPKGSPFEEFFEDFFNRKGGRQQSDRKVSSLGSGFVVDANEGLVVTNNHVIDGADEIVVNFSDGSKLKVDKVLGKDTKTDLALLKVTPKKPLKAVSFGNSSDLKVGDWVMAIGNPFGLGGSVTVGIISAKQRDINSGPYDDYLQTDAAINKGNSGGPLFNMDGQVIGVNTAIISPTGGSIGIGFAVPSDTAMSVVDQLRQFGETRRGWLGVRIQSVTEDIAESVGIKENVGALVAGVTPDGPAAKAGIEPGDVVTRFDGKEVSSMRGLPRIVSQTPIGKKVDVELLRKGQKLTLQAVIGRLQEDADADDPSKPKEQSGAPSTGQVMMGMRLAPLTDDLRKTYGLDQKVKGVVVTSVEPQSQAAQKGIKVGDVIVEASQDAVTSAEDVA
jgi:serine protease Do